MPGGISGRETLRRDIKKFIDAWGNELDDFYLEAGLDAGEKARDSMRNTIATTPSGLVPGKPNRILSGYMYDSADYSVVQRGHKISVKHGWLRNRKKYFLAQEYGTGAVAFGMFGLTKAQEEAKKLIQDRRFDK